MQPRYHAPARRQPPPKAKVHTARHRLIVLVLGIGLVLGAHSWLNHMHAAATSDTSAKKISSYSAPSQIALTTMDGSINEIIASNSTVDISATIIDLTSGASRNYGPNVAYEAASTGKLITAVDALQKVEAGSLHLNDTLEDGNTIKHDLQLMIVNSDNNAWQSLIDKLGDDQIAAVATSLGINGYNLDTNELTSSDIAGLLQKLWSGKILDTSNRTLLLQYMKQANYRDYIVAAIPADVTVYHKAGLLDDRIHDAAIIDATNDPIILVIFTNGHGTYDFTARTAAIQAITHAALTGYDIK